MRRIVILILLALLVILMAAAIPAFSAPAGVLQSGSATPAATPTRIVLPNTTPMPGVAAAKAGAEAPDVYITVRVTDGGKAEVLSLRLNKDGTAEFATTTAGEATAVLAKGAWKDNGDGTITVTMSERDGKQLDKPIVIKFKKEGVSLSAVEYDPALFGAKGFKLTLAAEVARKVKASLFTIDLAAGFPLDPTFLSVQAGGEVDASNLGGNCRGFINAQPVVTVNWTGKADVAQIFYYSSSDPTLVVLTPDGKLLCSDDAGDQLLDPTIRIENPVEGTYRIWLGSYAKGQLIPGVLVLTTKPEVNVGEFSLANLVSRPALVASLAQPTPQIAEQAFKEPVTARMSKAAPLQAGGEPITAEVTSEGKVPVFALPIKTRGCAGLVGAQPDYTFDWAGQSKDLRIFFESELDSTLLVVGPNGLVACSDDRTAGENFNPLVDLPNPAEGSYAVYVGRLNPAQPVKGTLTITEAADAEPVSLPPAKK
jgi:hypothetical protein